MGDVEDRGGGGDPDHVASTPKSGADAGSDATTKHDAPSAAPKAELPRGGIVAALRRSPLVGADLDFNGSDDEMQRR